MKPYFVYFFLFLLFSFFFSPSFAQEVDNKNISETKKDKSSIIKEIDSPQAINDQILFKNESGNPIITITDEGSDIGSITLPKGSAPIETDNKLYNVGGTLNFNGIALGSGGASAIDDLSDAKFDGNSLFLGKFAGANDDGSNNNVGVGYKTLNSNTTGNQNTAIGYDALFSNTIGLKNTANGYQALYSNTSGNLNTANGLQSLYSNTEGFSNTANGMSALYSNTTGFSNTANGYYALSANITGTANTANGSQALYSNTTGSENTANGIFTLYSNATGKSNTANGYYALFSNTTGDYNTAIGYDSGPNSVALNNTTALGNEATTTESNQIVLGNASVQKIGGYAPYVQLSDRRYKRNIKENVSGLEFIIGLRPVTYNFDVNAIAEKLGEDIRIDEKGNRTKVTPQTQVLEARENKSMLRESGFIAQEVEELVNKLGIEFGAVKVPKNEEGMYTMNYSEFVVPLVKAVQEQQAIIQNLSKRIEELESRK
ncbi:MAG: tail fiber domain-containing protein [Melioribacteraceae bacterium]